MIDAEPGTLAGAPAAALARAGAALPRPARDALLLLAAHPFLPLDAWARLRGLSPGRFRATCVAPLAAAGLIRTVPAGERPPNAIQASAFADATELAEATAAGLALLAAQAGVSLPAAVRWAGWAGGGPATPIGARQAMLTTLSHTLGLYRLLIALHAPLAAHRFAPDDALLEWLPGTARRWRGVWPDAFARIRHLGREYPAFIEYERGSHTPAQLVRKFLAYARYAERDGPARDGLAATPPVLVVAIGDADEARIAGIVAVLWPAGDLDVAVLLTTEARLLANGAGWLGRVWRSPRSDVRRYWPWEIERVNRRH